jgi:peptidoglycan/xylan/chitin deacetylase (PgdA/CDA1 family)
MDLLEQLHGANPLFRMTAFAIPAKCPDSYIESLPDWIEVVPHGWQHGEPPIECKNWSYDEMATVIDEIENFSSERWQHGFKAPGWQISDDCYEALDDYGWWIADQPYNDERRPEGLRVHRLNDGDHVHTHIQDWGSNGLNESWDYLVGRVTMARSFELVSEVVT